MHYIVEDIEFDFEDSQGEIHPDDQYLSLIHISEPTRP